MELNGRLAQALLKQGLGINAIYLGTDDFSFDQYRSRKYLSGPICSKLTRASAQRVTNTLGQHHFLIIKYFKVNDNDIRQDIVYNVSL